MHTYGVFPPKKMPAIKPIGQFQIENGDRVDLEYHYQSTAHKDPQSWTSFAPLLVAPFRFPRFDYIIGFYSASHVFSLVTRLGPIIGSGEEYVKAVALMLLEHPERLSEYLLTSWDAKKIFTVRFFVVGLVPDGRKWREFSRELDKEWSASDIPKLKSELFPSSITDWFPPSMVAIRRKSRLYLEAQSTSPSGLVSGQRLLDHVIERVHFVQSEREWFAELQAEYHSAAIHAGIKPTHILSPAPGMGLWSLTHSMEFGGYIGCLTFAHLIPFPFHSPLCREVLIGNHRGRFSGGDEVSKYSKILIEPLVYWILGLPELVDPIVSQIPHLPDEL